MTSSFVRAKQKFQNELSQNQPIFDLFNTDKWIANSLLQKAIRRGETEIAERAALTFLKFSGSAIWRRLIIIAFEDVGAASAEVVALTVAASADADWRKQTGGDIRIACHLAKLLAEAPKSRSAEHLITAVNSHPSFKSERKYVGESGIRTRLAVAANTAYPLTHRALAALLGSGLVRSNEAHKGDLPGLLDIYRGLGVPEELAVATGIAARRVRDPITLMVPLVWLAANDGQVPTVMNSEVPHSTCFNGVPMYALDKHTRVGREAIRNLIKGNSDIRDCLHRYVATEQWKDAAYMAAFYADAAPLALRFRWGGAGKLEQLGTEADMSRAGASPEGIRPLLEIFRANIEQLNELRVHASAKKLGLERERK